MTVPLTPTSAPLPGTVSIPADGELVNSSSVAGYVQVLLNALRYACDTVDKFVNGGLVAPLGSLDIGVGTGNTVAINSLVTTAPADGGGMLLSLGRFTVNDLVISKRLIQSGGVTGGVFTYQPINQTVYWDGVTSMTAGTVWRIQGGTDGDSIRFVNDNPQIVVIQDPASSVIENLGGTGGSPVKIGETYVRVSGVWKRGSDPVYH